ncbi:MAG: outer membrane beta-barrel protein [Actinomycetota bacterium]
MKKKIIALSLFAASTAVFAQNTGWYVGGSAGQSKTKFKNDDFAWNIAGVSETKDTTDTAWKLFGGYNFNQYFAVEVGYADLGTPKYKYSGAGVAGQMKVEQNSAFAAAKATLPVGSQFNLFGKLGATSNHSKSTWTSNIGNGSDSDNHIKAMFGVGAEFLPIKNVGIRVEYENYGRFGREVNNNRVGGRTDVDMWSVGAVYKF